VTEGEFVLAAAEVSALPDFDALRFIIYDFTRVSGHGIGAADIEHVAAIRIGAPRTNPNIRVVLVTVDEHAAALARTMNSDPDVGTRKSMIFASEKLAREWLALQPVLTSFARIPRFEPDEMT
jgi:hypothetical protein